MRLIALSVTIFVSSSIAFAQNGISPGLQKVMTSLETIKRVPPAEMEQIRKAFGTSAAKAKYTAGYTQIAGGWNGGGGEGIACWATKEEAAQALDGDGRVKPEARKTIKALYSSDLWEFSDKLVYRPAKPGQSANEYLRDLTFDVIMPVAPYLAQRLFETAVLLHPAKEKKIWNAIPAGSSLIKINDAGPRKREMKDNCRAVQMVVRYLQRVPGEKFPRVFIDYDEELFQKFLDLSPNAIDGVMFQAGLHLHEQLYAIGAEIGMKASSMTRQLTAFLMSQSLWSSIYKLRDSNRASALTSVIYGIGFRHISWIYSQPTEVNRSVIPFTKESRQLARARLAMKYEQVMIDFRGEAGLTSRFKSAAEEAAFVEKLVDALDGEESFLFLASNEFNAGRSKYSGDVFITNLIDDRDGIAFLCDHLKKRKAIVDSGTDKFYPVAQIFMYNKAVEYCGGLGVK